MPRFGLLILLVALVLGAPRPDLLAVMLVNVAETEEESHHQRTSYLEQQTRQRRLPAPPDPADVHVVEAVLPEPEQPRPCPRHAVLERPSPRVSQGPPAPLI